MKNLKTVCPILVFAIFLNHKFEDIMSHEKSRRKSIADENPRGINSNLDLGYCNTLRNLNFMNCSLVGCRGTFSV